MANFDFDTWAAENPPLECRRMVALKPGEVYTPAAGDLLEAPPGHRWEADAEYRARLLSAANA